MKKLLIIFTISMLASVSRSQGVLSFPAIRDSVLQNHPMMKMADASVRAAEAGAEGAWSWMAPELGAGFFQTPYNPAKWEGTPAMPGMGMFTVSAEQMFPNRKAQQAQYDYLKSKGSIESEKKSGWLNELMSQARYAYYNLIIIEKKSSLYRQNEKLLDFLIRSAEIRYRNNLGNLNSYYKVKAALAKLKTAEKVLEADRIQHSSVINNIMQRNINADFAIDTVFKWYSFDGLMEGPEQFMETSEFRVLEKTIESNQLQQQYENASLKPQLGLKFEHMAGFGHQPQMFSLMAMIKLPIAKWSARSSRAAVESLEFERQSLKSRQFAYLNEEIGRSRSLYAELQGIQNELKMYDDEILPALLKNFQTLQISYEQNKAEIFEIFDAWQDMLDARLDYLNSLQKGMQIQSELLNIFQIIKS